MFLRAINTIKVFSILAFLFMILWVYAYLHEQVRFFIPGNPDRFIMLSKGSFFYIQLISFTVINLFLYWYSYFLKTGFGKSNTSDRIDGGNPGSVYITWFGGFHFAVNIQLLGVLYFYGFQNINNQAELYQYSFFLLVGGILTIICLAGILINYIRVS